MEEVKQMREGIHPKYYEAKVTCNCGNVFYTGQQKMAQARGRVDKFNKKYGFTANN